MRKQIRQNLSCMCMLQQWLTVASEAYHDWSGEAAGARLRVNFTLKLLLSQNFCNRPLMRFISFASYIGPAAAVPAGPAPSPLAYQYTVDMFHHFEMINHFQGSSLWESSHQRSHFLHSQCYHGMTETV